MGNEHASSKFQQLRQQPRGHDSSLAVNSDSGGELPASPPQLESPRQQQRRMSSCAMENSRRSESPQPSSLPIGGRSLYQQQLGGTNRELPLAPPLAKNHLPQTPNSHLLSPCNRTRRNRRMSVAGDHEALRRELAKAADANTGSGTGSGGQTPQRRFSRATPNSGGSSRKLSSIRGCDDSTGLETTTAEHLKLTSYQMQILQQSWPRIRSQGALSGLFRELAQTNSAAKEMFQKMSIVEGFSAGKCCDQKEHVRMLVELIEFALQNLNAPCKIVQQKCHSLGELHYTGFGATNESKIWDDFGECLSKCLAKAESVRGKREAFRAWCTLTTFMCEKTFSAFPVESMRAGYVQHFKRRSLTRHSSGTQLAIVQLATVEEVNPNGTTASITATSISTSSKVASNSREKRSITPTFPPFSTLQL